MKLRSVPTLSAAIQAGDSVLCRTSTLVSNDLDRLGCPPKVKQLLPALKAASAAGLFAGEKWPRIGQLTAAALVVYFVAALGFHARARDEPVRYLAALAMLGLNGLAFVEFSRRTP